jgi:anti-anti-sigma factor
MEISEDRKTDAVVLALSGKLDETTAKTFEEKLLSQIESGERRFVINLAQLDYISSSGLRVFLIAAKRLIPRTARSCCVRSGSSQRGVRHSRVFVYFFHLQLPR